MITFVCCLLSTLSSVWLFAVLLPSYDAMIDRVAYPSEDYGVFLTGLFLGAGRLGV